MVRLFYIDNLKSNVIILVILHHIAIAYGALGDFPIVEAATDAVSPIILTLFTAINQSFFMSLFFLLSGFFTAASLTRKSKTSFIKDRLIRLGIPLIFYSIVMAPIVDFLILKSRGLPPSFNISYEIGPLWFIETILIFSLIYILIKSTKPMSLFKNKFPTNKAITFAIVTLALLTFIVRIFSPIGKWTHVFQLAHMIHYIFAFYIGIVAFNNNWFENLKQFKIWKIVAIVNVIVLPLLMGASIALGLNQELFFGGFTWQSLLFSTWDTVSMMSIIISLLVIFKERFNKQNSIQKFLSPNYYGAYIFHTAIILALMIPLLSIKLPSTVKGLIVAIIAIPSSFILTAIVRKIPGVKRVLG